MLLSKWSAGKWPLDHYSWNEKMEMIDSLGTASFSLYSNETLLPMIIKKGAEGKKSTFENAFNSIVI